MPHLAGHVGQEPLDAATEAGRPALTVAGDVQDLDLVLDDPRRDVRRPGDARPGIGYAYKRVGDAAR
jgi:hypothetical protein